VYAQAVGEKYTVTFLQDFSQRGRRKATTVSLSHDDSRAIFLQYIRGRLSEAERARFEERLLEDQDFSDAAAVCEQDLIDAYAMHQLDEEEARAIGLWIEASPDRVERVAMARALLKTSPRRGQRRQVGVALAIAAVLLAAVTLDLVGVKMRHHGQDVTKLSASNIAPQNQPSSSISRKEIRPDIILIAAERTRGKQKTATYQVHRESPVELQIVLPSETERSGYQLKVTPLSDPDKILFEQTNLDAHTLSGQLYLSATLRPGSLAPDTYTAFINRKGSTLVSTFTVKWTE
jgi:hypothetical protein